MGKIFGRGAVALAWLLLAPPVWSNVSSTDSGQTTKLVVVILTVIVSLLIGMLLYQFSQRSSQVQFQDSSGVPESIKRGAAEVKGAAEVMPLILDELNRLPVPLQHREQVARSVSNVMVKTLQEQVGTVKRQIEAHYDHLIEEHRRSEAVLQHKYQKSLLESKQTVSVLESIAEGLVVVNNKGEVVMMNPAAEKLLAVSQQERIGKSLLDDLKDEQLISLAHGPNENREIVLNAKQDSTKKILRASNAVITDEDGKTVGMVAVLSDVTKQRELDQLKSEFVSKVSHELRTPIIAMQHALSILSDHVVGPLSEEQQKFVELSQRNLQRLNGLINDLLDLSKLEAKKMELRLSSTSIAELIQNVCESLDAWAKSKAITLTCRVPNGLPDSMCDPARVTQVLTNLIGNAVKFTPKQGRVTIEAKLAGNGRQLEVSVTDTGEGITKEDIPKLFTKFQQVGERSSTDISGSGLGLAISKEIVELHQGLIWAESDPTKRGARFAFTLPLEQPTQTPGDSKSGAPA